MGKLNIVDTKFQGLYLLEPTPYKDERGEFYRVFCEDELQEIFPNNNIKQINHSVNYKKGVFRGLHYQHTPDCEIKMVKCIKGKIVDIVVDIRRASPTFLQTFSVELSEENKKMIYIPKGFAHGFQTMEDDTQLLYLHSNLYTPNNEDALNIEDPLLNINLPLDIIEISKKDKEHKFIDDSFKGIDV